MDFLSFDHSKNMSKALFLVTNIQRDIGTTLLGRVIPVIVYYLHNDPTELIYKDYEMT